MGPIMPKPNNSIPRNPNHAGNRHIEPGGAEAGRVRDPLLSQKLVTIKVDSASLEGMLSIPARAKGVVVFAHGSGSSRFSLRNQYVAEELNKYRLGTLLLDLLTLEESQNRANVFDIAFLAGRVEAALRWLAGDPGTENLPISLFGASTGAAAALITAAKHPDQISAVVSRGGRPDLAGDYLNQVAAPTLLLVGARDGDVLMLNQGALKRLNCVKELRIIEGATHLFEEPGTLETAARYAAEWLTSYGTSFVERRRTAI